MYDHYDRFDLVFDKFPDSGFDYLNIVGQGLLGETVCVLACQRRVGWLHYRETAGFDKACELVVDLRNLERAL